MIIDGKAIAAEILNGLASQPAPKKFLAGVLVGNDPASESFQKLKEKTAQKLGVDYRIYRFPENSTNDDLRQKIGQITAHKTCGGLLVQLPLPAGLNTQYILNAIPQVKDPDVMSERSLGAFYTGRNKVLHLAAATTEVILRKTGFELAAKRVAIVGRGLLIGRPIAVWLLDKAQEVVVIGRGSDFSILKEADLVICAAGQAGLIQPTMLKDGAGVIDFGYSRSEMQSANGQAKLLGDLDSERLAMSDLRLAFYTPTPGGTGPILVAKLFENFYALNTET